MAVIIKMPKLGLEMERGTLLEWFYDVDEDLSEGDVIAEVESEKSIGEVEAREDGVLRRTYLDEGDSIPPGKPIGILAGADEDISDLEAEIESELGDEASADADTESTAGSDGEGAERGASTSTADGQAGSSNDRAAGTTAAAASEVKASPRARQRAEELSVDLTTVEGTGPMGSVTADDVEAADAADEPDAAAASEVKASPRARQRAEELGVDLTTVEGTGPMGSVTADDVEAADAAAEDDAGLQQVGAEGSAALRYQRVTGVADLEAGETLIAATEAVRSAFEEQASVTDVVLLVASAALSDQPVVNGTYAESTHQVRAEQDVALVTDYGEDLETHVVESVESKSLGELVAARTGEDAGDATASFTVANAAHADGDSLLVNPPAVAALEVDTSAQRAVPNGDGVDLQPLVTASLTYDTYAVGTSEAEAFLDRFFERAEEASSLVLDSYRGTE